MPIYDYLCSNCGQTTEVIHGIAAPAPRFCPVCGAEGTLRKALTTPAVHFKGSGWAKKDRSTSSAAKAKAGSSSTTDSSDGTGKGQGSGSESRSGSGSTPADGQSATTANTPNPSED